MASAPNKQLENDGFWTGLVVGGILGTVAGFFLGENDKNQIRDKLKDKAFKLWDDLGEVKEGVEDKVVELKDEAVENYEALEEKTGQAADIARIKLEQVATTAQQTAEQQVKKAKKVVTESPGFLRKNFFFKRGKSLQKEVRI